MSTRLRDAAVALSLANLSFITVWSRLLDSPNIVDAANPRTYFIAIVLNVVLLAAVLYVLTTCARRLRHPWVRNAAQWTFLLAATVPFNGIRVQVTSITVPTLAAPLGETGSTVAGMALAFIVIGLLVRWQVRVVALAATAFLVCLPFVAVTFFQVARILVRYETATPHLPKPTPARAPAGEPSRRVLWLLFDGMDYRMTFSERPRTVRMREIDRLCEQALCASNAYPPGGSTAVAMPALITGRRVAETKPYYPGDLMLRFAGTAQIVPWSSQPNLFSKARALGVPTGVVGWYLPYCDALGEALTDCLAPSAGERSLAQAMALQVQTLIATVPAVWRLGYREATWQLRQDRQRRTLRYLSVLEAAMREITNPESGLLLVHWPIPHEPFIYDRFKDDFGLDADLDTGYFDNLQLVDRTLGEIRRAMELAGTWEQTTVLITADHSWAESTTFDGRRDYRVPFVLKLAGRRTPLVYAPAFNTILIHDLVLELLKGELSTPVDVVRWLDRHRGTVPRRDP
jgi:hypothetical protein